MSGERAAEFLVTPLLLAICYQSTVFTCFAFIGGSEPLLTRIHGEPAAIYYRVVCTETGRVHNSSMKNDARYAIRHGHAIHPGDPSKRRDEPDRESPRVTESALSARVTRRKSSN